MLAAAMAPGQTPVMRLEGSTITASQIDAAVARPIKAGNVTGVGITIFNRGKVAYTKAYGYRDVAAKLPLTPDSVLGAASLTKVAFTYLVMQLVEEGTLDLDKPVNDYLPTPLVNFEPGSRYAYSGEGMELLQFLVEQVTKMPLQALMQQRVFGPLGMTRTSMLTEARFETDYANGYDEHGRSLGHQHRKSADAAGSMQTTLHDFTLFVQAIIDGRGLHKSTLDQMLGPQIQIFSKHQFPTLDPAEAPDRNRGIRLSYGLGWGLFWTPYGKVFFKEGHDDGFRHYTAVFDQSKDGIVILTNSSNGEGIYQGLLETLLKDTFTPIEWEGFTPYATPPPHKP
jgi:CubicO group peptidase (beta-lactamase class C family)